MKAMPANSDSIENKPHQSQISRGWYFRLIFEKLPLTRFHFFLAACQSLMLESKHIIDQTKRWIQDVVVGCNFCPFAAPVLKLNKVHYEVETSADIDLCLEAVLKALSRLDTDDSIETSFLIFPEAFDSFDDYLDLVEQAELLMEANGYEGIYQMASFHPLYLFSGSDDNDAANYTNRSIYPMLHFLREASIDKALQHYQNPEAIPDANIDFARQKGLIYMKMLREACITGE